MIKGKSVEGTSTSFSMKKSFLNACNPLLTSYFAFNLYRASCYVPLEERVYP